MLGLKLEATSGPTSLIAQRSVITGPGIWQSRCNHPVSPARRRPLLWDSIHRVAGVYSDFM
ncbi:hypothetical protein J2W43_002304 [Pseudomonas brassicacearum]|jgi:hypothetical protein|uniref:Uncharacterized protein n=1 Tax=Pseudomonas brassicacearum TaxID=930166 RepID=A0AAW8MAN9_9PSED|nr:hypothetical protein [Pseudomonas brassicacearum]